MAPVTQASSRSAPNQAEAFINAASMRLMKSQVDCVRKGVDVVATLRYPGAGPKAESSFQIGRPVNSSVTESTLNCNSGLSGLDRIPKGRIQRPHSAPSGTAQCSVADPAATERGEHAQEKPLGSGCRARPQSAAITERKHEALAIQRNRPESAPSSRLQAAVFQQPETEHGAFTTQKRPQSVGALAQRSSAKNGELTSSQKQRPSSAPSGDLVAQSRIPDSNGSQRTQSTASLLDGTQGAVVGGRQQSDFAHAYQVGDLPKCWRRQPESNPLHHEVFRRPDRSSRVTQFQASLPVASSPMVHGKKVEQRVHFHPTHNGRLDEMMQGSHWQTMPVGRGRKHHNYFWGVRR